MYFEFKQIFLSCVLDKHFFVVQYKYATCGIYIPLIKNLIKNMLRERDDEYIIGISQSKSTVAMHHVDKDENQLKFSTMLNKCSRKLNNREGLNTNKLRLK